MYLVLGTLLPLLYIFVHYGLCCWDYSRSTVHHPLTAQLLQTLYVKKARHSIIVLYIFILFFQGLVVFIISFELKGGKKALVGLLNKSVAGLGNSTQIGTDLICNKVRLISFLLSKDFLIVSFTNFTQASTCSLLWWLYDLSYSLIYIQLAGKLFKSV